MKPTNLIHILTASIMVLALWFIMGFLVPLFYSPPSSSGEFGDGFGSVNALFSGISVVALTYTIILQIDNSKSQRKQERFTILLKLVDDARADLASFEFEGCKGLPAITELQRKYVFADIGILEEIPVTHLVCVVSELNGVLTNTAKHFHEHDDEYKIINDKVAALNVTYFERTYGLLNDITLEKNSVSHSFKDALKTMRQEVRRYLSIATE